VACAWLLLAAGPALADTATLPRPEGPSADAIDNIYRAVLGVTVTIFVLVAGWLLYVAIRFRQRPGDPDVEPPQVHGSRRLEIGWTIVPVLILVALSAYTFVELPDVKDVPAGAQVVRVQGLQFAWNYTYANGAHPKDAATLVIPTRTPIKLLVTSKDVIHDWWVPDLGYKIDAIPGKTNTTWIEADQPGTYRGQCAEFCGVGHATMLITVKAVPKQEFSRYMASLGS
jgi:cytochrome c oxidase subunit 2